MSNYITDEDLDILMNQGDITRDEAKKLLKKYLGDVVSCLLELNTNEEQLKKKDKDDIINPVSLETQNINEYRKIIDEKDRMYEYISKQKEETKKKEKLRSELLSENKSVDHLETPKLNNEDLYYLNMKGNFTSIKII